MDEQDKENEVEGNVGEDFGMDCDEEFSLADGGVDCRDNDFVGISVLLKKTPNKNLAEEMENEEALTVTRQKSVRSVPDAHYSPVLTTAQIRNLRGMIVSRTPSHTPPKSPSASLWLFSLSMLGSCSLASACILQALYQLVFF